MHSELTVSQKSFTLRASELEFFLNQMRYPITLWKPSGNDFILFFLNDSGKILQRNNPWLRNGYRLKQLIPNEYEKISYGWNHNEEKVYTVWSEIISPPVIVKVKPLYPYYLFIQFEISDPITKIFPDEFYKKFVEQSPLSIVITDVKGNIQYVNPKFLNLTGYSLQDVIGKNPRILKSGDKSEEEYKNLWDTILSGNVWKGEFVNIKKNGEKYHEVAEVSPIKNEKGEIINFVAIKEDITELKNIGDELKKYEKLAALGRMTAYITHEIKTPLTSIKINVDLLEKRKSPDAGEKKSLAIIRKEVKRLSSMLKNVLQFAYQPKLHLTDINLHKKIGSIHEFLKPTLLERGITLNNRTSEQYIYGDDEQIRTLFVHLIENSIESLSKGGRIDIYDSVKDGKCLVYIKDNGCGIKDTKNIFEPFFTTKKNGTGLGLTIVKNIAEQNNGSVKLISSRPGETIFEIVFQAGREKNGKTSDN